MYVDDDGDLILENRAELEQFVNETACEECRSEAGELLALYETAGVRVIEGRGGLVFATTCHHLAAS